MNETSIELSIVILTWNSEKYIERCIGSLAESMQNSTINSEILIVDNGSSDNTPVMLEDLKSKYSTIITIMLNENKGTTVSRNLALKMARGKTLCIMDSDVEVQTNVFLVLLEILKNNESIGIVVPKILYPTGNWQKSFDQFPTLIHKLNRLIRLRNIENKESESFQYLSKKIKVDYAISAFWLFRRDVFDKVGLLDEKIFYSPEDVDYCLRVWQAGFKIVYVPSVNIMHHTQEISRGWKLNKSKLSHIKGLFYLFLKHRYFFKRPVFCQPEGRS